MSSTFWPTVRVIALRVTALACLVAASYVVGPRLMPSEPGDPNIGLGLAVFALLVVTVAAWGLLDGMRLPRSTALVGWLVVATLLAVGWSVGLLAVEWDGSLSVAETAASALVGLPFTIGLVAFPAVAGVAIGRALRRRGERPVNQ